MIKKFFSTNESVQQLEHLHRQLLRVPEDDPEHQKVIRIAQVVQIISANSEKFDANCQQNIEWIGSSFVTYLQNLGAGEKVSDYDRLYALLYRFVVEFDLSVKNDLSVELRAFQRFAKEKIGTFDAETQEQFAYARQEMPVALVKGLLNQEGLQSLRNVADFSKEIEKKFEDWDKSLSEHEKSVNSYKESLASYETAFNFVGLFEGFNGLAEAKKKELFVLRLWMIFFGGILLAPLVAELVYVYTHQEQLATGNFYLLGITALISLSLTLLLIYFFRLSVRSADSCKAQLLQLELRKTLCRFIQSYANYSKELKEKNPDSLAKFESIIFCNIVSTDDKLPSTFDGVDQMANLIKAIRQK